MWRGGGRKGADWARFRRRKLTELCDPNCSPRRSRDNLLEWPADWRWRGSKGQAAAANRISRPPPLSRFLHLLLWMRKDFCCPFDVTSQGCRECAPFEEKNVVSPSSRTFSSVAFGLVMRIGCQFQKRKKKRSEWIALKTRLALEQNSERCVALYPS